MNDGTLGHDRDSSRWAEYGDEGSTFRTTHFRLSSETRRTLLGKSHLLGAGPVISSGVLRWNSTLSVAYHVTVGSSGIHTTARSPASQYLLSNSLLTTPFTPSSLATPVLALPTSLSSSPVAGVRHQSQVSFVQKFRESIRRQVQENKEFQEGVKQLNEGTNQLAESDAFQRAKQAAQVTGQAAGKVVEAVEKVLESDAVKKAAEVTGKAAEVVIKVAEPIVDNPATRAAASAAQAIHQSVQDPNSTSTLRYTELKSAQERESDFLAGRVVPLEQMRPVVKPNEEATGVVVDQKSRAQQQWEEWKESNPLAKAWLGVTRSVEESDHPLVERLRDFAGSVGRVFGESETARVVKRFRQVDPNFRTDRWLVQAQKWIIPEIMEAYLKGNDAKLKEWCGEVTYNVLTAGLKAQREQGLVSGCRLLDLRNVDLLSAKLIDSTAASAGELPVLVVSFQTQEVLVFRNRKGEIKVGREDHIEHCMYAAVFTKDQAIDPMTPLNDRTLGWRMIDLAKHSARAGV
ncbi:Tim44-domain-containing protein [Gonapodya prolifera JEL478]|uniref:Tim44-domain-containing protein n=1 Tax=Gonapodya prolifera (strain JEL478) TaxID=1344416 RepID=A0A139AF99_GONPJ|nr:Tim44-domain-containing protein [Gonapodya prolifera JEL478]|eukprot:KXS15457.1 Tim44-domain-containing protein [Gonapodya prolifera JEL478]